MSGGNYDCDYSHKNSNNNLEDISIEELDLSIRSERCLLNAEIYSVQDIVEAIKAPDDFLKIRNLGRESAEEICFKLEALGIQLFMPNTITEDDLCKKISIRIENIGLPDTLLFKLQEAGIVVVADLLYELVSESDIIRMGLKGPEIQILSDTIRAMNLRLGIFKEPISCLGIWDSLRERLESEYDDIQEILKTGFCDMIDVLSGADAVRTAKQLRKAGYLLVGYPGLDNPETCKKLREYFLAQPLSFLHLPERVVRRMNLACGKEVCLNYFVKHPVKDWFAIIQNFDDCLEIAKRLKNLHIRLKDATNLKHGEDMFLRKNTILYSSIEDLPISKKITQALIEKDITSVEQLVGFSSVQIKDQQILGDTSIESIRKALHEGGLLLKDDFVMRCETCEERFVSDDIERVLCDDCIAKKKRLSKNSKIEIAITGPEYGIYSNTPHGFTLWANIKNISSDLLNIRLADFYLVEDEKQISPSYFLTGYSFDEELIMPGTLKSVGKIWDTARFKFSSFLTDDTYAVFVIKITSESHKRLYKFVYKDETWIMDDYYTGKDIGR